MRVLVCGGRYFARARSGLMAGTAEWRSEKARIARELALLRRVLDAEVITQLIEGGALGADRAARYYAFAHSIPIRTFEADWNTHRKAAGSIRNQRMLDEGKPDLVIAFPGGRGTADMVRRAKKAGVPVMEVKDGQ